MNFEGKTIEEFAQYEESNGDITSILILFTDQSYTFIGCFSSGYGGEVSMDFNTSPEKFGRLLDPKTSKDYIQRCKERNPKFFDLFERLFKVV